MAGCGPGGSGRWHRADQGPGSVSLSPALTYKAHLAGNSAQNGKTVTVQPDAEARPPESPASRVLTCLALLPAWYHQAKASHLTSFSFRSFFNELENDFRGCSSAVEDTLGVPGACAGQCTGGTGWKHSDPRGFLGATWDISGLTPLKPETGAGPDDGIQVTSGDLAFKFCFYPRAL